MDTIIEERPDLELEHDEILENATIEDFRRLLTSTEEYDNPVKNKAKITVLAINRAIEREDWWNWKGNKATEFAEKMCLDRGYTQREAEIVALAALKYFLRGR